MRRVFVRMSGAVSRSARLAGDLVAAVPPTLRLTTGLTTATVTGLRVLVLVTSLVPVFTVFLTALGGRHRSAPPSGSAVRDA